MPTYNYICINEDCGEEVTVSQTMSEDPKTKCPSCHKETLRRVIAPVQTIFKGNGWTDKR